MADRKEYADVKPDVVNHFKNRSGQPGTDFGNKGKFTPNQLLERIRVHAIAIATGEPTMSKIVEYWKERYGISIAIPSESEWRRSNLLEIERKKTELIEKGEISVPVVSEEALADSMMSMVFENTARAKSLKAQTKFVLKKLDIDKAGKDELVDKRNNELLKIYKVLAEALTQVNDNLESEIKHLFAFSSKIKIKDNQIKKIVNDKFDSRLAELEARGDESDEETLDPFGEVDDTMRARLLEDKKD